jgi:hypothetical protein
MVPPKRRQRNKVAFRRFKERFTTRMTRENPTPTELEVGPTSGITPPEPSDAGSAWIAPQGQVRNYRAGLEKSLAEGRVPRSWVEHNCEGREKWLEAAIAGRWVAPVHLPWAEKLLRRSRDLARKRGDRYLVQRLAILTQMDPVMGQLAASAVEQNPDLCRLWPES